MVPSIFALIVLTIGVVLIHFGLKDVEGALGNIAYIPTPYVQSGLAEGRTA